MLVVPFTYLLFPLVVPSVAFLLNFQSLHLEVTILQGNLPGVSSFLGGSLAEESRSSERRGFLNMSRGGKFGGSHIVLVEDSQLCSAAILFLICDVALKKLTPVFIHPLQAVPMNSHPHISAPVYEIVCFGGGRQSSKTQQKQILPLSSNNSPIDCVFL